MRVDSRANQLLAVSKSTEYPAWAAFTPEPDRPVSSTMPGSSEQDHVFGFRHENFR